MNGCFQPGNEGIEASLAFLKEFRCMFEGTDGHLEDNRGGKIPWIRLDFDMLLSSYGSRPSYPTWSLTHPEFMLIFLHLAHFLVLNFFLTQL